MQVDFVIPWVDGSDPEWLKLRNRYSTSDDCTHDCRFRDWGILKYWFRAVETYAPWVNRIFFVTSGQIPGWLNTDHPKLRIISHKDYIPAEYLPTFSSHTIELNLHRIADLSEHFVYFNDDMFLNAPVKESDFFHNGLPKDIAVLSAFAPYSSNCSYTHAICNVMSFLNRNFDKHKIIANNPELWFSPLYGRKILNNIYYSPTKFFSNLLNAHIPSSMLKSTFVKLWDMEPELLHNTCMNKFRGPYDVNQYIMSYYNICCGMFYPRNIHFGKCYSIGQKQDEMYEDILSGRHQTICINDHPNVTDYIREQEAISTIFQQKLPIKSSYEL